jgi:hypothetical protein
MLPGKYVTPYRPRMTVDDDTVAANPSRGPMFE